MVWILFLYIIPSAVHLKNTERRNNILHPEWLYNKRCSGFNEDKLLEQTNTAMSKKKVQTETFTEQKYVGLLQFIHNVSNR